MPKAIISLIFFFTMNTPAYSEDLYQSVHLKKLPQLQSDTIAKVQKGSVLVLERKGFWVKIRSHKKVEGWIQLSNIKMKEEIVWMRPINTLRDTGRLYNSKQVNSSNNQ